MKYLRIPVRKIFQHTVAAATVATASLGLTGCPVLNLPPVSTEFNVATSVQVSSLQVGSGSPNISVEEICELFDDDMLRATVRQSADNLIMDNVEITRVDLVALNVIATEGDFDVFTSGEASVEDTNRDETLLLGTTADNSGLGNSFMLSLDTPVDLISDLDAEQCDNPIIHLEGADIFESDPITFDVTATVLVYTRFPES